MLQVRIKFWLLFFCFFISGIAYTGEHVSSKKEILVEARSSNSTIDKKGHSSKKIQTTHFSQPFIAIANKCIPAVVSIQAEDSVDQTGDEYEFFDQFFFRFFGEQPRERRKHSRLSQGSGFLISPDGYIVTNNHVVYRAQKVLVHLQDGSNRQLEASLVGSDNRLDIALLKINESIHDLPYLLWGNSDDLQIGEFVMVIGNPLQFNSSVSVGVVSGKTRRLDEVSEAAMIQVDAAMNPGSSGGPLVNEKGEVVGVNTAIASSTGGSMGLNFATDSNTAKASILQIKKHGSVTRSFLGVTLQPIDHALAKAMKLDQIQGMLISQVIQDSPAEKAGLKQGDVILELNHIPIQVNSLRNDIVLQSPGTIIVLTINRDHKIMDVSIRLEADDANVFASNVISDDQLGLSVANLTSDNMRTFKLDPECAGIVITKVKPHSPASQAGLRPGYLIMGVNHKKVTNVKEFKKMVKNTSKDDYVLLLVRLINGEVRFVPLESR